MYIDVKNKCENCIHVDVCKYSKEFNEEVKAIEDFEKNKVDVSLLKLEIACSRFERKPNSITFGDVTWAPGIKSLRTELTTDSDDTDYCKNCPNKISGSSLLVGDTPCQFCEHGKIKVTC